MKERPTLKTERLILRPFSLDDGPVVKRLAGDRDIASTTARIPHPYEDGMAEAWISTHHEQYEKGESVVFAMTLREDRTLVGAIGLELRPENAQGELGYWVGKPYWNCGYCTEAAREVLWYAFGTLGLNRVYAQHFGRNPASGRVLRKIGMKHEGSLRRHFKKWEKYEEVEWYGILSGDTTNGRGGVGRVSAPTHSPKSAPLSDSMLIPQVAGGHPCLTYRLEARIPQGALVPFSAARIHPFRSIESGLATLRDHPLDDTPTVGEILISGRQCPEGMHVVRQQHPSLDHKRMGRTKRSDRFSQGRAHIEIGEKGLAPIGVDGEEIGATWHMGATVIRHDGIIPPMNGAGTRPNGMDSTLYLTAS